MTKRELKKVLNEVYKKMDKWQEENKKLTDPFPREIIHKREELLRKEQFLWHVYDKWCFYRPAFKKISREVLDSLFDIEY